MSTRLVHRLGLLTIVALCALTTGTSAHSAPDAQATNHASTERAAPFPPRPNHAPTGSAFLRATVALPAARREQAILAEIRAGNVPSHIRRLAPVHIGYQQHAATIYVLPDYLAVGSDEDYVIIPMAPRTAMYIAREFGFTLPTRKLVDDIYASSTLRLSPVPMHPGPQMTSNAYYLEHDRRIKIQMAQHRGSPALIAGHKKDVVLTRQLLLQPHKVAIYGWHRQNGEPIQPLSLFHHIEYVDYSHGVRLISRQATVDGHPVDLSHVLADAQLNPLFSDEGRVSSQSYL